MRFGKTSKFNVGQYVALVKGSVLFDGETDIGLAFTRPGYNGAIGKVSEIYYDEKYGIFCYDVDLEFNLPTDKRSSKRAKNINEKGLVAAEDWLKNELANLKSKTEIYESLLKSVMGN